MAYTRMVSGEIGSVLEVSEVRCEDSDLGPRVAGHVADRESGFGLKGCDSGAITSFPSHWPRFSLCITRLVPIPPPRPRATRTSNPLCRLRLARWQSYTEGSQQLRPEEASRAYSLRPPVIVKLHPTNFQPRVLSKYPSAGVLNIELGGSKGAEKKVVSVENRFDSQFRLHRSGLEAEELGKCELVADNKSFGFTSRKSLTNGQFISQRTVHPFVG